MWKIKEGLILLVLVIGVVCLQLDIKKAVYQILDESFIGISIPTDPVLPGLAYQFQIVPKGWGQRQNMLLVRRNDLNIVTKVFFKIVIFRDGDTLLSNYAFMTCSGDGNLLIDFNMLPTTDLIDARMFEFPGASKIPDLVLQIQFDGRTNLVVRSKQVRPPIRGINNNNSPNSPSSENAPLTLSALSSLDELTSSGLPSTNKPPENQPKPPIKPSEEVSRVSHENYNPPPLDPVRATASGPIKNLVNLFSKLPSPRELDRLVVFVDSFGLSQTIQSVYSSEINCKSKTNYLSDLLGRLQRGTLTKKYEYAKVSLMNNQTKDEVRMAQGIINQQLETLDKMNADDIQSEYSIKQSDLDSAYIDYNSLVNSREPQKNEIDKFKVEIKQIEAANEQQKVRMQKLDQQRLVINAQIADLENALKQARDKKASIEASLMKSSNAIASNNAKKSTASSNLIQATIKLKNLEGSIVTAKNNTDQLVKQTLDLRSTIDNVSEARLEIEKQIDIARKKIFELTARINDKGVEILKRNMTELTKQIMRLGNNIDRLSLQCTGVFDNQLVSSKDGTFVYAISETSAINYIEKSYNCAGKVNHFHGGKGPVRFASQTIFSPNWLNTFRHPSSSQTNRPSQSDNPTNVNGNSPTRPNRPSQNGPVTFTCLQITNEVTGYGVIIFSEAYRLTVELADSLEQVTLNIGICSRIEFFGDSSKPNSGDTVFWRGNQLGSGEYNIFSITVLCIE